MFEYLQDDYFAFTGESASYLFQIITVGYYVKAFFGVLTTLLLIFIIYSKSYWLKFLLVVSMLLTIMSSRIIAIKIYPEGKIRSGWFGVCTNEILLCNSDDDCEELLYNQTEIRQKNLWRLHIVNKNINETIFIGPFSYDSILTSLKDFDGSVGHVSE
jgi:hypothetical protein